MRERTDNRGYQTTYSYDALNRMLGKSYGGAAAVSYTYDNASVSYSAGRLTAVTTLANSVTGSDTSATQTTQFDALGRVLASTQTTNGNSYSFQYTYNLTDAVRCETYPSGRTVVTSYDGANRVAQVASEYCPGATAAATLNLPAYETGPSAGSGIQYAAHGEPVQYRLGNNVWRNATYNTRLQLGGYTDLVNNNSGQTLLQATLNWGTTNNNGNLRGATWSNGGPGYSSFLTFNQSFGYDGVNRLTSATDSGGWSRNFGFDAFGNMWVSGWSGIAPAGNMAQSNVYNANNQISGGTYDQAGDQTNVGGNTLNYDYEGHVVAETDGVSKAVEIYVYDGDGHRVEKYVQGGSARTVFVYDAQGLLAAEYSTTANSSPCLTCYLSPDQLGTARLVTDQNGNVVARHDYLPFGEEIAASTAGRTAQWGSGNDSINQKFTGKERDSESGLDYFGARYYGSGLGRFSGPDEVNVTDERLLSPSSTLNKYAYAANNPLKFLDPDGRDVTFYYDANSIFGHALLLAYNQQNGDSAVYSFGPKDPSLITDAKMLLGQEVPSTKTFEITAASLSEEGILSADDLRLRYASVTIQTNPGDTQQVINSIRNHPDGKFALGSNNYTTSCASILRKINQYDGSARRPHDLFNALAFPGVKFLPGPPEPRAGRDYGRPRYDPFDLLFAALKAQNCQTTVARWYQNGEFIGITSQSTCP